MDTKHLLNIRIRMESLITQREMMIALNKEREYKGYGVAYSEDAFYELIEQFIALMHELETKEASL